MEQNKPPSPQPGLTNAEKIVEFHDAVGAPVPGQPVVPSMDILELRHKLLQEEFEEVTEAWEALTAVLQANSPIQPADVTEWVHELADLLYVTYGAILACGVDRVVAGPGEQHVVVDAGDLVGSTQPSEQVVVGLPLP